MTLANSLITVYDYVKIDIVAEADLANETLFEGYDSGNGRSR
jgi:hypothetical protein